ncbi:MAG: tRNA 2-thiocytidine biosynthesis TtcA family protein [Chlamydia sp.]
MPPWTGIGRRIESMIRKALYDFSMIPQDGSPIAIALSGGKDSLTMLFMLHAISGRGFPPFDLIAVHVDGAFSCGAGVNFHYLQKICQDLGVPLIQRQSIKKLETLECYSCSRERRSLLFQAAKEHGATTIAFGHHKDDNAETLLMNLLHKGEFAGLLPTLPMHHYGVNIIRPLIFVAEEEIVHFADQYQFRRISCRCPVGQNSMRKKTDELIATLQEIYPHARDNLARASLQYGSKKALEKSFDEEIV